jgi:ornithine cyclodeaminase/alanine dehydrogenase-like protein (mu-crystallin family)
MRVSADSLLEFLKDEEVAKRLSLKNLIPAIDEAFRIHRHSYVIPPRMIVSREERTVLVMPCYAEKAFGIKVVTTAREPGRGLGVLSASYTLFDGQSGEAVLFLDATSLTDLRTAATSAVATRLLALPDAKVLGLFGTGRQARAHVAALRQVRAFTDILVCGSTVERGRSFAESVATDFNGSVRAVDAHTCAAESQVLCTCTTSITPLFRGETLAPGTHLNLVGSFRPETREVDDEAVQRSRIVVETYEGVLAEVGDILIPLRKGAIERANILADLHEALSGKITVRRSPGDITLFKSVGCALEDIVAAQLLHAPNALPTK